MCRHRRVIDIVRSGWYLGAAILCFIFLMKMPCTAQSETTSRQGTRADTILHIALPRLTTLDGPLDHLELLEATPPKRVRIPDPAPANALFLSLFYSWQQTGDPTIVVMVVPGAGGDSLYVDRNYDNDLSNDGAPEFFPDSAVNHTLEIVARGDPRQRTRLLLARTIGPGDLPDSLRMRYVDHDGNLVPAFARFVGMLKGRPDFTGIRGTFFWDGRVTLRRGVLVCAQDSIQTGLFDVGNNGLFNDSDDVVLIDLGRTGHLSYMDDSQVVGFDDVIALEDSHWEVTGADKYGTWIELRKTDRPLTSLFSARRDSAAALQGLRNAEEVEVDSSFWAIVGETLDGHPLMLNQYQNGWTLLIFWGEWCAPCLQEIPALRQIAASIPSVRIVGFLNAHDIAKARRVIASERMNWPQVLLSLPLAKQFRISAYPTNLLLLPGGARAIRLHAVNTDVLTRVMGR